VISLLMIGATPATRSCRRMQAARGNVYEFVANTLRTQRAGNEGMKFFPLVSRFHVHLTVNLIGLIPSPYGDQPHHHHGPRWRLWCS